MDFFAQQDRARRKTGLFLVYFTAAVLLTAALVYFIVMIGLGLLGFELSVRAGNDPRLDLWHPPIFWGTFLITLGVVAFGSILKKSDLGSGGTSVALLLGGRPVLPDSDDFYEVRLRNVVEEMAIASGIPVPKIYLLEHERGINAFAAGYRPGDAVVAVTYGTMVGLKRDELQGVVAHEFSHILNGDMRMNLNLISWLYGLSVIALTGKGILRGLRHVRGRGGAALAVVGGGLFCVGSAGAAFAALIKSLISKEREYLADAAAVQFTRNPGGLAGALKKIGGLAGGSRLRSTRADEISHMCFGNALRGSPFATHPPLGRRIKWLDPSFNGQFERVTLDSLYESLAQSEGAPNPARAKHTSGNIYASPLAADPDFEYSLPSKRAVGSDFYYEGMGGGFGSAGMENTRELIDSVHNVFESTRQKPPRAPSPHELLESIGKPMAHHADAACALIASIPEAIKAYARDPYGARMLVYFLLLDPDDAIRGKQMALIQQQSEPEVVKVLEKALLKVGSINPAMRLPIIDLAIPALRFLSTEQYRTFIQIVRELVEADDRVDIFEYSLQRVLAHHLEPLFAGKSRPRAADYYSIRGLARETSVLLSVLARKGHDFGASAATAFLAAVDTINEPKARFELLDEEQCGWAALDQALEKLNEGSAQVKKLVLAGALTCLMHDREITVEEVELFRAVSDSLGCPVPPWVTPAKWQEK